MYTCSVCNDQERFLKEENKALSFVTEFKNDIICKIGRTSML